MAQPNQQVPQQWHAASFTMANARGGQVIGSRPGQGVPNLAHAPSNNFAQAPSFSFFKVPPHLQQGQGAAHFQPATSWHGMPPAESPLVHCPSNASYASDKQEELNLHPTLNKLRKPFEADGTAILARAMGGLLAKDLPEGALAEARERAVRQQNPLQKTESQLVVAQAQALAMAERRRKDNPQATKQASPSPVTHLLAAKREPQRVYFMRHGESEANISRRDVPDPNLTQLGLAQAKSWQETIGDLGAELVLVSPLRRAVQTACHAFEHEEVPLMLCRFAREIGWSANENTIHMTPDSMQRMLDDLPRGDEVFRVREALIAPADDPPDEMASLQRLKVEIARRPERTIVVVCHFGVIATLIGSRAKNGDVFECEWGYNEDINMVMRHKTPLSEQQCICG